MRISLDAEGKSGGIDIERARRILDLTTIQVDSLPPKINAA
jgi:hypothetical protein